MTSIPTINRAIPQCARCPALRTYCAEVGRVRRRAYRDDTYWARPVPGFGDAQAGLWIVGLAPAAHGANRTGRMFTGDRSGDFLYTGLHRAGFANQVTAEHRGDGLALSGCYISAALRCAPPANKPTAEQLHTCRPWLTADFHGLTRARVIMALGGIAWNAVFALANDLAAAEPASTPGGVKRSTSIPGPRPKFGHGVEVALTLAGRPMVLIGCYHVSQQNTFTGRLTPAMLDAVLTRVRDVLQAASPSP